MLLLTWTGLDNAVVSMLASCECRSAYMGSSPGSGWVSVEILRESSRSHLMDVRAPKTVKLGITVAAKDMSWSLAPFRRRTHKNALHCRSVSGDSSIPGTSEPGENADCSTSRW